MANYHINNDRISAIRSCGCCWAEMSFSSVYTAKQAFLKVGIGEGKIIKDSIGDIFLNVSTHYFYVEEQNKWRLIDMEEEFKKLR